MSLNNHTANIYSAHFVEKNKRCLETNTMMKRLNGNIWSAITLVCCCCCCGVRGSEHVYLVCVVVVFFVFLCFFFFHGVRLPIIDVTYIY